MYGGIKREIYDEFQSLLKEAKKTKMTIKELKLSCDPRKFHFNLLKNYLLTKKEGNFKDLAQSQNLPSYDTISGFDKGGSQENWTRGAYQITLSDSKEIFVYLSDYEAEFGTTVYVVFVAFEKPEALDELLSELTKFYLEINRGKRIIVVGDTNNLEKGLAKKLSWDDIVLPIQQKEGIRGEIETFCKDLNRDYYKEKGIPYRRGLLFYGKPGNGKTMINRIVASYNERPFIYFQFSPNCGQNTLDEALYLANELAPSTICFEDLDRSAIDKAVFTNRLDGLMGDSGEGILIVATLNNDGALLDKALIRPGRFDRVWHIEPTRESRKKYLTFLLSSLIDDGLIEDCVDKLNDLSMVYLREFALTAVSLALQRKQEKPTPQDFEEAFRIINEQIGSRQELTPGQGERKSGIGFKPTIPNP